MPAVYVCIHTYIYIHVCVCVCVIGLCMYVCSHLKHSQTSIPCSVCTHVYMYTCINVYYICIYVYTCIYVYLAMYVCLYTYVYALHKSTDSCSLQCMYAYAYIDSAVYAYIYTYVCASHKYVMHMHVRIWHGMHACVCVCYAQDICIHILYPCFRIRNKRVS
jgi:hypothetical protein